MMGQMAYRVRGEESKGVMGDKVAKGGVFITFERSGWLTASPTIILRIERVGWKVEKIELTVLACQLAS